MCVCVRCVCACVCVVVVFVCLFLYSDILHSLVAWLVPHETAAVMVRSVYTLQPCTMKKAL